MLLFILTFKVLEEARVRQEHWDSLGYPAHINHTKDKDGKPTYTLKIYSKT